MGIPAMCRVCVACRVRGALRSTQRRGRLPTRAGSTRSGIGSTVLMMKLHIWNGQEDDPEWLDSWLQEIDHDVDTWRTVALAPVSYTHLRAHETGRNLVCRLL